MSGIVAGYGNPKLTEIEEMQKIAKHRGKYNSGIFQKEKVILAQNYFEADKGEETNWEIPVYIPEDKDTRICYDGQIGNNNMLLEQFGIFDGPYREERLLISLYKKYQNRVLVEYLKDAIFAFVISDGEKLLAARDGLGIKTLFYGYSKDRQTIYFSTELKSLLAVTKNVYEFPPGHYVDQDGQFKMFAQLPRIITGNLEDQKAKNIANHLAKIVRRNIQHRIDLTYNTGCLLSGGLDSSIIATLFNQYNQQINGPEAQIKTFALGVGENGDLKYARIMSEFLKSEHYELKIELEDIVEVLPKVVYHLESFDPSLVRSSASNYLIAQFAGQQGIQILLSGEGGDELFCGYDHFKDTCDQAIFKEQKECLKALHNNAALRLDRMNACHSIKVITPFISEELLNFAMEIPINYKLKQTEDGYIEKWILRKAFENDLPPEIAWRTKQEFSKGSGTADVLNRHLNHIISDKEFDEGKKQYPLIRNKEEYYYFKLFIDYFGEGKAVDTVGQWDRT
jgi:asparagine synthase (glutamine-hydrolysing)